MDILYCGKVPIVQSDVGEFPRGGFVWGSWDYPFTIHFATIARFGHNCHLQTISMALFQLLA